MAYVVRAFQPSEVNRAGAVLCGKRRADVQEKIHALDVVNNFRASHAFPLNTFQMTLRKRASRISSEAYIGQRIKRLESITRKLNSGTMKLSQMQDVAGCRAVMPNISQTLNLAARYKSVSEHRFVNFKDYIQNPKSDGYRGVHLIFEFQGRKSNQASQSFNGSKIEIQIRTRAQHAWATAVEAVGTFTRQALKWQGGSDDWRRFFVLMSSASALREGFPVVEQTSFNMAHIRSELIGLEKRLRVREVLRSYSLALNYAGSIKRSDAKLMLLHMKPREEKLQVRGFKTLDVALANKMYIDLEQQIDPSSGEQAVLVRVDSVHALAKAFPNYFLDTQIFSQQISAIVRGV
jgi:hypothetical protein